MKKRTICSLIAGLSLITAPVLAQEPQVKPETEKRLIVCRDISMAGRLCHEHQYDIDGDGVGDIGEIYPLPLQSKYPLFYYFDKNKDGKWSNDEKYIDEKMDDWNGNEMKVEDFIKKHKGYASGKDIII